MVLSVANCDRFFAAQANLEQHMKAFHKARLLPLRSEVCLETQAGQEGGAQDDDGLGPPVLVQPPPVSAAAEPPPPPPVAVGSVPAFDSDVPLASAAEVVRLEQLVAARMPHQFFGDALPRDWVVDIHERQDRPASFQAFVSPAGVQYSSIASVLGHLREHLKEDVPAPEELSPLPVPEEFICPVHQKLFVEPVSTSPAIWRDCLAPAAVALPSSYVEIRPGDLGRRAHLRASNNRGKMCRGRLPSWHDQARSQRTTEGPYL